MENKEQDNKKTKPSSTDPKPTDEVQLTIETVTPDTHKSVPETPVDSDRVEESVETANDNKQSGHVEDNASKQDAKSDTKATDTSENREEVQYEDDGNENENQYKGDNDDEGDERDKIETIAP